MNNILFAQIYAEIIVTTAMWVSTGYPRHDFYEKISIRVFALRLSVGYVFYHKIFVRILWQKKPSLSHQMRKNVEFFIMKFHVADRR